MSNNTSSSSGMGLGATLTVIFIVLKCLDVIDWSWWWVLSPFWIPLGLCVAIFIVFVLIKAFL